ncbi:MAG: 50S ribosomal protein L29 [Patescibacteria group bacterium]
MPQKTENFKGMKKDELRKKLALLQEEARVVRFKAEGSKSKNVKELSGLKKQIAQMLTELNKSPIPGVGNKNKQL